MSLFSPTSQTASPAIDRAAAPIPFVDLPAQHAALRSKIDEAIARVIDRGTFVLGDEVERFEAEFATYCGARFAVGVGSGLDALTLSLAALGIGPGDEVITVANTFIATALAIVRVGARPVLVDCEPGSLSIAVDQVAAAITPRTRAILPVHLYGRMAEMPALMDIAERHGMAVIEDAAQAHGAALDGRAAGAWGNAGCFSFYPSKNLGTLGDGGAVTTNDAALADRLRALRNYGARTKYQHELAGFNSRLDELQAAVLRVKLPHLDDWNHARRVAAARLRELLTVAASPPAPQSGEGRIDVRALPRDLAFPVDHVHHLFPIEVDGRDKVAGRLGEEGVGVGVHYPTPVHLAPAMAHLGYQPGAFPVAERAAPRLLSLPMYPEIRDDQLERVAAAVRAAL
ncbi:MAG: DegT/DnrJ/EryC1/StrS family aminotransferase [Pirellulales bacterium]